ncbi:hypothetical protein [Methylobacterium mesophilicum]|uniref:hypothetical protein n=1 Tax=Methylobacterium mesophilicum TaxID=39956 RepID=UPI002F2CB191
MTFLSTTRSLRAISAGILCAIVGLAGPAAANDQTQATYETESFQSTYTAGGTTYNIEGRRPKTSGNYPVYVHIGGTGEPYQSLWALAAIEAAAERGMVAASVQYANGLFGNCSVISEKAKAIFDSSNANSAIKQLCSSTRADCSKGVVTGGLSQGSIISVLSHDYDSRVRASFGQGTGSTYTQYYDLSSCIADGKHTQSGSNLRIINGEHDGFVGGSLAVAASQAALVTGLSCSSGSQSCFRTNGSGWYVVKDSEVQDGYADHCFMGYGGLPYTQCMGLYVDSHYASGRTGWELNPTMDWLAGFVGQQSSTLTASK